MKYIACSTSFELLSHIHSSDNFTVLCISRDPDCNPGIGLSIGTSASRGEDRRRGNEQV